MNTLPFRFDIDLTFQNPPLLSVEASKCSFDIIAASQSQRIFNYNCSFPHFRDEKFLKKALKRYWTMLIIKRDNLSTTMASCYDNGLIWHAHLQHVLLYEKYMVKFFGQIPDHDELKCNRNHHPTLNANIVASKTLWKKYRKNFIVRDPLWRASFS